MQDKIFDTIIIGCGPAGLSAAIYAARAGLSTLVFGVINNSNAYKAHIIENYFGFDAPITGPFLMEEGKKQAARFGATFVAKDIIDIKHHDDGTFTLSDTDRLTYHAKTIIICSGLGFKPSGIKNEQQLIGRGISFCVTCDGFFFKGKKCAVVGSANFAGEEALQLLTYTPQVTILSHGKDFSFGPKILEGLQKNNVMLVKTPRIKEFKSTDAAPGGAKLEKIVYADGTEETAFEGVFMALGNATAADFATKLGVARTGPQNAYIVADPRTAATNVPGIYAAGDCTGGNAQAAKSAGEGCNAAISIIKLIKGVAAYVDYD